MIDIKKSIATGWGKGQLYPILKELQQFSMGLAGIQGEVYFVEGNAGYDGNDGKSWNKAFKTLSVAMAASHANIAASSKGWAARNTIFCKGDALVETLTKLAQKTDIIGVGSVHGIPQCRLEGNHTIEAASTANYMGCRFFNMDFYSATNSAVITIPADQNCIEFHNCRFMAVDGATHAIHASAAVHRWKICNCKFIPNTNNVKFSTVAILFAGDCTGIEIENNIIWGAKGIQFSGTNVYGSWIKNNLIYATTFCIDDDSNDVIVANNRFISAVDNTSNNDGILDWNVKLAIDNIVTGSNHTDNVPTIAA